MINRDGNCLASAPMRTLVGLSADCCAVLSSHYRTVMNAGECALCFLFLRAFVGRVDSSNSVVDAVNHGGNFSLRGLCLFVVISWLA